MSNLVGGRTNQKLRTHVALVESAAQFMKEGKSFTVAEVADRAKVGRTTAYRYFPSVETLIAHAALHGITDLEQQSIGVALDGTSTPEERLRAVIGASDTSIRSHEYLYRTMLRMSLTADNGQEEGIPPRLGVRKKVLDSAIGGLRSQLGDKRYERLTAALSLFLGIEAAVVLRDVCHLSAEKAREIKLWGANVILQAALAEAAQAPKATKPERNVVRASGAKKGSVKAA